MRLSLTVLTAAFLGFSSLNVDAVVIKYYCDGSGNHVAVPNICKNTCWGQNCMRLGTQFTFNTGAQAQNRALSGDVIPTAAQPPCGSGSAFGDATLVEIDEYPIASSNNPTSGYSLRCASASEQRAQGGSVTASGASDGDLITFELVGANTLGVDWCSTTSACQNDNGQFQLSGNNYVLSSAVANGGSSGSSLSSLGSTPSPPRKRDTTPWVRSLARTVRIHARAWPSKRVYELLDRE